MKPFVAAEILISMLISGCVASSVNVSKPHGERIRISVAGKKPLYGELISVGDSSMVFFLHDTTMRGDYYEVPFNAVQQVSIDSYSVLGPKILLNVPIITWNALMTSILFEEEASAPWSILFIGSSVLYVYSWLTSPRFSFHHPFSARDMERLNLFARYPQRLNDHQLRVLLASNDQLSLRRLP